MLDSESVKAAVDTLRDSMFSYLATVSGDRPNVRVMRTSDVSEDGTIWYVVHRSSPKMHEINANDNVCIVAWKTGTNLRVWGKAQLASKKEAEAHLDPDIMGMFPEGSKDPQFAMIKVIPTEIDIRHYEN